VKKAQYSRNIAGFPGSIAGKRTLGTSKTAFLAAAIAPE
jgi:hypothetical protein